MLYDYLKTKQKGVSGIYDAIINPKKPNNYVPGLPQLNTGINTGTSQNLASTRTADAIYGAKQTTAPKQPVAKPVIPVTPVIPSRITDAITGAKKTTANPVIPADTILGAQTYNTSNISDDTMKEVNRWVDIYNNPSSGGARAGAMQKLEGIATSAGISVNDLLTMANGKLSTSSIGISNTDLTALQTATGVFKNGTETEKYMAYNDIKDIADKNGMTVDEASAKFGITVKQPSEADILLEALSKSEDTKVTDNTQKITDMFKTNADAATARLQHAIAKTVAQLNDQEKLIGQQYVPLKNQTDLQRNLELRNTEEAMSQMGLSQSGDNISAQLAVNSDYGNRQNSLNLQEQNAHDEIRKAISQAESDGNFEVAQFLKENDASLTEALINESNRVDEAARTQSNQNLQNAISVIGTKSNIDQQKIDNDFRTKTFDYQVGRDAVTDKQWYDDYVFRTTESDWNKKMQQNQFDFQKEMATLDERHYTEEMKLKLEEIAWSKNANNPQVKAQILDNQIKSLQLKNLPEEQKLELEKLKQDVAAGKISMDIAKTELGNLRSGKTRSGGAPSGTKSPKPPSTDSKGSTKDQNSNFQKVKAESQTTNSSPEDVINDLLSDPKGWEGDIGPANYSTWLQESRNTNYKNLINNWATYSSKEDLITALTSNKDYWVKMLGQSNYNTLLGKANATIDKKGW